MSSYTTIDSGKIVSTIELLEARIEERFPDSGLRKVCRQLGEVAVNMKDRAEWIRRPVHWLRILTWVVCLFIVGGTIAAFLALVSANEIPVVTDERKLAFTDFVTVLEAGINDILLVGAAIFFLLSFETRYKRRRALKALHELRSIAHVIDMHQLTKDPHRIATSKGKLVYVQGRMSPKIDMTEFQLRRYLDYCSEMLSLTGKIAAVYVQAFDDGVAMASASELETLTTGLSSKIWQKILILESYSDDENDQKITVES